MNTTQQVLEHQKEINDDRKLVREMVMESYYDIASVKGCDCNEFPEELRISEKEIIEGRMKDARKSLVAVRECYGL